MGTLVTALALRLTRRIKHLQYGNNTTQGEIG
jgi:hypothetical protein